MDTFTQSHQVAHCASVIQSTCCTQAILEQLLAKVTVKHFSHSTIIVCRIKSICGKEQTLIKVYNQTSSTRKSQVFGSGLHQANVQCNAKKRFSVVLLFFSGMHAVNMKNTCTVSSLSLLFFFIYFLKTYSCLG